MRVSQVGARGGRRGRSVPRREDDLETADDLVRGAEKKSRNLSAAEAVRGDV